MGTSPYNLGLAKEFYLPEKQKIGQWELKPGEKELLYTEFRELSVGKIRTFHPAFNTMDRVEARGVGFSEMDSYW